MRGEIMRYSTADAYPVQFFKDVVCTCGGILFGLLADENEGAAVRKCAGCKKEHPIGDSAEYLEEAELEESICLCGGEVFEITGAVSLYKGSNDIRWLYIGCRCPKCGLCGVYADWKCEFEGSQEFLRNV